MNKTILFFIFCICSTSLKATSIRPTPVLQSRPSGIPMVMDKNNAVEFNDVDLSIEFQPSGWAQTRVKLQLKGKATTRQLSMQVPIDELDVLFNGKKQVAKFSALKIPERDKSHPLRDVEHAFFGTFPVLLKSGWNQLELGYMQPLSHYGNHTGAYRFDFDMTPISSWKTSSSVKLNVEFIAPREYLEMTVKISCELVHLMKDRMTVDLKGTTETNGKNLRYSGQIKIGNATVLQCNLTGGPDFSNKAFKIQESLRAEAAAKAKALNPKNKRAPQRASDHSARSKREDKKEDQQIEADLADIVKELDEKDPGKRDSAIKCQPNSNRRSKAADGVRKVIADQKNQSRHCYEQILARSPTSAGLLKLQVTVGQDGCATEVIFVKDEIKNDLMNRCLDAAIKRWSFPAQGKKYKFTYPFRFVPALPKE